MLITTLLTLSLTQDTVVRMEARPVHPGVATLVEELSIGVADGEEQFMLGDIADLAIGRDGSIYAFDRQVPVIRHYDVNGRYLGSIGRRGQGPGEYLSVSGLAITPDGRLLVWDTGNWRTNVYAADGAYLMQWSTPSGSTGATATFSRALMVDTAGTVITRRFLFNRRDFMDRPTVWMRYSPAGRLVDTLRAPASAKQSATLRATSGPASTTLEVPFAPRRLAAMSPLGGFVAGYPDRYAFEIHVAGRPIVSVRRDVTPEPVTRVERTTRRREVEDRMRQTDPTWTWNGPDIPESKPSYADLQVGLDGRIWVSLVPEVSQRIGSVSNGGIGTGAPRRPAPVERPTAPPRPALYDVFEPDGRYLGQVQVPPRVSSVLRQGDRVWAVAFDEDDVPRIKRYRIAWGR